MMFSIFLCAYWLSAYLLWKNVYPVLCPFFNWAVYFFRCWIVWVLCIFWILTLYQIHSLKMSSLIQQVVFPSIDRFLFCVKDFRFGVVSFVLFFSLAWGDRSKKILLRLMWKSIVPIFSSRSFMISDTTFKSYFCIWYEKVVQFDSSAYSCPVFSIPFIKDTLCPIFHWSRRKNSIYVLNADMLFQLNDICLP